MQYGLEETEPEPRPRAEGQGAQPGGRRWAKADGTGPRDKVLWNYTELMPRLKMDTLVNYFRRYINKAKQRRRVVTFIFNSRVH